MNRTITRIIAITSFKRRFCSSRSTPKSPTQCRPSTQDAEQHLFSYTSGRWLEQEAQHLEARYLDFNIPALKTLSARIQKSPCISMRKLPEGLSNKVFSLDFKNGSELTARFPTPAVGNAHYTIASEVATLDFLRNVVKIPVPRVLDWSTVGSPDRDAVGAEFMLMERAPGVQLSTVWSYMSAAQRLGLVKNLVDMEGRLVATKLAGYGSLYYRNDCPENIGRIDQAIEIQGKDGRSDASEFVIGPVAEDSFWTEGVGELEMDRGPWNSPCGYYSAVARREMARIQTSGRRDTAKIPSNASPDAPAPSSPASRTQHIGILHKLLAILPYMLPPGRDTNRATLWHHDLHENNIFVNEQDPTVITSIIDWQNVWAAPLFARARFPSIIDCAWPYSQGVVMPTLPNDFSSLTSEEQATEEQKLQDIKLKKFYEVGCRRLNPMAWKAIEWTDRQDNPVAAILQLLPRTAVDGPLPLRELLIQIFEQWDRIMLEAKQSHNCPISFTEQEIRIARIQTETWGVAFARYEELRVRLLGRDGWVSHEGYDEARREYLLHKDELEVLKREVDRVSGLGGSDEA